MLPAMLVWNLLRRRHSVSMWSCVGGPRQKQGKRLCVCMAVCECVCNRWSEELVLATKRGMPADLLLLRVNLLISVRSVGVSFGPALFFLRQPRYVVDVHFYMEYLLVQHCHGQELSCSTKSFLPLRKPLSLWTDSDRRRGTSGDFCRSFSEISEKQETFGSPKTCCSELSSSFVAVEGGAGGDTPTAPPLSRHPLAFHASWYYRLFIQPLFKLDADRVALDMCIAEKKNKTNKKKKTNDGDFKDKCLNILLLEGVERGRMIGFGTEMMLFFFSF
ncbi:hypothetical protein INR49_030238 [Caranx melampygus]|nr:hypothetical protein INR49_030238 [Caranx melampygus]